jgi:formamidopyrimidine-DNA glycosylase
MPELPELHVFARNLDRQLGGRVITDVRVWRTRHRNFKNQEIKEALVSRRLAAVRREGKQVHFHVEGGQTLAVHLMLCGEFSLTSEPASVQSARLALAFDTAEWLVISDVRGLASFALDPSPPKSPDALSPELTIEYLRTALQENAQICVKEFLVDQRIVRGIGNAYSDEILWVSRIAPQSLCGRLPDTTVQALHQSIRFVLQNAIASLERLAPDAINGERRDFLAVHHPDRTHSPAGSPIHCTTIGFRKTYFCEEQVLYSKVSCECDSATD